MEKQLPGIGEFVAMLKETFTVESVTPGEARGYRCLPSPRQPFELLKSRRKKK